MPYTITPTNTQVNEGSTSITFTITRTGSTTTETVRFSTTQNVNGNGVLNNDDHGLTTAYNGINNLALTFTASTQTRTVTLLINNDSDDEPNETFGVLLDTSGGVVLASTTFTIVDNDPANSPPTITVLANSSYSAGTVLTGADIFSASDPQGTSTIDFIRLYDANVTNGAVWRYNGSIINPGNAASGGFSFEYGNRHLLTYTVGTGVNDFQLEAFDTAGANSATDPVHSITGTSANSPPTITILAGSSYAAGTVLTGTDIFSASDPNGSADLDFIRLYDANVTNGAVWRYNGSIINPGNAASGGFSFSYGNRHLLTYTVGTGVNDFQLEAFDDSGANSVTDPVHSITGTAVTNGPPTITVLAGPSYAAGTVLTGTDLFSASDPQGTSTIDFIRLYDANVTNGAVWRYNGSIINPGNAASGGFSFEYGDRHLLTYTVGTGLNDFQLEAFDTAGANSVTDPVHSITGTAVASGPPTITILASTSYAPGTVLTGADIFSASDPQGASDIDFIRLYDLNVTNGAVWRYNGSIINPGGAAAGGFTFEYNNRHLLTYTVGSGANDFQLEAFDNSGANSVVDPAHTISGATAGPTDTAGQSRATARDLGILSSGNHSLNEWVGAADGADYFRIEITQAGTLQASISGMSNDADLYLLSEGGSILVRSREGGAATDSVGLSLTPGVYYLNVDQYSGDTNYQLQYNFTPAAAPPQPPLPNLPSTASLFNGSMFATLAEFALAAYSDHSSTLNGLILSGWQAVSLPDLSHSNGRYVSGNAELVLLRSADALVVSFAGTEDGADQANWPQMDNQLALYDTIIRAINSLIISDQSIARVYVTGHSLGAAMVDAFMFTHQDFTRSSGARVTYEAATFAHPDFLVAGWGLLAATAAFTGWLGGLGGAALGGFAVASNGVPEFGHDSRVTSFHNFRDIIRRADFQDGGLIPGHSNIIRNSVDNPLAAHEPTLYEQDIQFLGNNGVTDAILRGGLGLSTFVVPDSNRGGDNSLIGLSDGRILVGGSGDDTYSVVSSLGRGDVIIEHSSAAGDTLRLLSGDGFSEFSGSVRLEVSANGNDLRVIPIASNIPFGSQEMAPITIFGHFTTAGRVENIRYGGQTISLPTSVDAVANWGGALFFSLSLADVNSGAISAHGGASTLDTASLSTIKNNIVIDIASGAGSIVNGLGAGLNVVLDFLGIENIIAGDGNDQITGSSTANHVMTGDGDDVVNTGGGNDTIVGGDGAGNDSYIGGDGVDTVIYTSASSNLLINLSQSGVNATGADIDSDQLTGIENVIGGSGNDRIVGGAGVNQLYGGAGNDNLYSYLEDFLASAAVNDGANVLDGGEGNDTLRGSGGVETLRGGDGDDSLGGRGGADLIDGGEGIDMAVLTRIHLSSDYTFDFAQAVAGEIVEPDGAHFVSIERVQYSGGGGVDSVSGGALDDLLQGGANNDTLRGNQGIDRLDGQDGADTLLGGAGDDFLFGGDGDTALPSDVGDTLDGGAGADWMEGGAGDDLYVVDNTGDVVSEAASQGNDAVYTSISYTLRANVEVLATATAGAINLYGNELANLIVGNGDVNTLDGAAGVDTLIGGGGNDLYLIDNIGDVIIELAGEGAQDAVYTALSFYQLGANVEVLAVTAASGTYAVGNGANNLLVGAGGADTLDGGAGVDTLIGGAGNDLYFVDDMSDVIIEGVLDGANDAIYTALSYYQLGANVETLSVTGTAGTYAIGNGANNLLVGNAGADTLDGGTGIDTLIGGSGDDLYFVDNIADVIIENAGEGANDVVYSALTFYQLGANVEVLSITTNAGAYAVGNELNNLIVGNSGGDGLEGRLGADVLVGGNGSDAFVYNSAAEGGDAIVDFVSGSDWLQIDASGFGGGLVAGAAVTLISGSNPAASAGAAFLYDTDDGRLFWDADGAGGADPVMIATLSGAPSLSASDIIVGP